MKINSTYSHALCLTSSKSYGSKRVVSASKHRPNLRFQGITHSKIYQTRTLAKQLFEPYQISSGEGNQMAFEDAYGELLQQEFENTDDNGLPNPNSFDPDEKQEALIKRAQQLDPALEDAVFLVLDGKTLSSKRLKSVEKILSYLETAPIPAKSIPQEPFYPIITTNKLFQDKAVDKINTSRRVDPTKLQVMPEQLEKLKRHLYEGIALIREKRYEEAITHFHNDEIVCQAGFRYRQPRSIILFDLPKNPKALYTDLRSVLGQFYVDMQEIEPSSVQMIDSASKNTYQPKNSREAVMLRQYQLDMVLSTAKGWIEAYQYAMGQNVSTLGPLLKPEEDVAQFLMDQGISPTNRYMEVYRLDEALQNIYSPTRPSIGDGLIEAIQSLAFGDRLLLGRTEKSPLQSTDASISRKHATLFRTSEGNYILRDGFHEKPSSAGTYTQDENGYWSQITEPTRLKPGDRIRLGKHYEILLP